MANVLVADFRRKIKGLEQVIADFNTCVDIKQRQDWCYAARRILAHVQDVTCKTAKSHENQAFTSAFEQLTGVLEKSSSFDGFWDMRWGKAGNDMADTSFKSMAQSFWNAAMASNDPGGFDQVWSNHSVSGHSSLMLETFKTIARETWDAALAQKTVNELPLFL